ncbi:MAG: head GIN domain-containing protein [Chloroflexota bacterium]
MRRLITVLGLSVLFITAGCTTVQGDGNVITQSYEVSDFTSVDVGGVGELVITIGEPASLEITTDTNLHEYIEVTVEDNTLDIGFENGVVISNPTELTYAVTVPSLESVSMSGSASFSMDEFTAESFTLSVSGAADVEMDDLDLESFTLDISGSADVTLDGTAGEMDLEVSGAADLDATDLEVSTATIDISGSSDVNLTVTESLTGEVSGAADLTYEGNPDNNLDISGSADINAED